MKHYEMRRAARRMDKAELERLLERGAYCIVSCIDENGAPYGVPLSYTYEPAQSGNGGTRHSSCESNPPLSSECAGEAEDSTSSADLPGTLGTIYFHTTNESGRKLDAFAANDRVCATVVEDVAARFQDAAFTTGFSSAMAFGRIRRVIDPVVVRKALVNLCMKYLPEHKNDIGAAMQADLDATAVWALDIEELSGKRN
ncbi:MAG: pyridoxamine 5'-phosphate oxidase family protein [Slackia sp.]|nr:pyridoxamine 5'-phosphate oxidase family protein [Slackia sp.]